MKEGGTSEYSIIQFRSSVSISFSCSCELSMESAEVSLSGIWDEVSSSGYDGRNIGLDKIHSTKRERCKATGMSSTFFSPLVGSWRGVINFSHYVI